MKKINRRSGFTLPEVLVTVTVVAVLAAVVVPAVTQYVGRGGAPATQTDLSQLQNAITGYAADTHAYPHLLTDLTGTTGIAGFKGPYLSATVSNPGGGTGTLGGAYSTGVSEQADSAAFTSSGLGVTFADSISAPTNAAGKGYLWLHVAFGTPCSAVGNLSTAFPGQLFSTPDNFATTTAYACTGNTNTTVGATDNVVLRFVTTGQ